MNNCFLVGKISGNCKKITMKKGTSLTKFKITVISPNKEYSTFNVVAYGDIGEKVLNEAKFNDMAIINCYAKSIRYKVKNEIVVNDIVFVINNIQILKYKDINNNDNIFNINNEIYADESLIFDENDIGKGVELLYEQYKQIK